MKMCFLSIYKFLIWNTYVLFLKFYSFLHLSSKSYILFYFSVCPSSMISRKTSVWVRYKKLAALHAPHTPNQVCLAALTHSHTTTRQAVTAPPTHSYWPPQQPCGTVTAFLAIASHHPSRCGASPKLCGCWWCWHTRLTGHL